MSGRGIYTASSNHARLPAGRGRGRTYQRHLECPGFYPPKLFPPDTSVPPPPYGCTPLAWKPPPQPVGKPPSLQFEIDNFSSPSESINSMFGVSNSDVFLEGQIFAHNAGVNPPLLTPPESPAFESPSDLTASVSQQEFSIESPELTLTLNNPFGDEKSRKPRSIPPVRCGPSHNQLLCLMYPHHRSPNAAQSKTKPLKLPLPPTLELEKTEPNKSALHPGRLLSALKTGAAVPNANHVRFDLPPDDSETERETELSPKKIREPLDNMYFGDLSLDLGADGEPASAVPPLATKFQFEKVGPRRNLYKVATCDREKKDGIDPSNFAVQIADTVEQQQQLRTLWRNTKRFYERMPEVLHSTGMEHARTGILRWSIPDERWPPVGEEWGAVCAAPWNKWGYIRCVAERRLQNGMFEVHFVDYGWRKTVPGSELRYLRREHFDPMNAQAIPCRLAGIAPMGQKYSKNCKQYLWEYVNNLSLLSTPLRMRVHSVGKDGVCLVDLFKESKEGPVNVANNLKKAGFAVSCPMDSKG